MSDEKKGSVVVGSKIVPKHEGVGSIKIYSGARPPSTDSPPTGTLLVEIPLKIDFDSVRSEWKNSEPLYGTAIRDGVMGWFRAKFPNGQLLDGRVGTTGCELNVPNVQVTTGGNMCIDSMVVTQNYTITANLFPVAANTDFGSVGGYATQVWANSLAQAALQNSIFSGIVNGATGMSNTTTSAIAARHEAQLESYRARAALQQAQLDAQLAELSRTLNQNIVVPNLPTVELPDIDVKKILNPMPSGVRFDPDNYGVIALDSAVKPDAPEKKSPGGGEEKRGLSSMWKRFFPKKEKDGPVDYYDLGGEDVEE